MARGQDESKRGTLLWALLCLLLSALLLGLLYWFRPNLADLKLSAFGRELNFAETELLWLIALLPLLLFAVARSYVDLPWQQRLLSFFLRGAFFCSLLLGLSRPEEEKKSSRICLVALLDVSTSVADEGLEKARKALGAVISARGENDEVRLLAFAEHAREVPLVVGESGKLTVPSSEALRDAVPSGATNVAGALELGAAHLGSDCVGRYVIFSDGVETRGSALSEAAVARGRGIRVHTYLLNEAPPSDVAVIGLEVPSGVRTGEPFELRVKVRATEKVTGELRLYQGETLSGLGGVRQVELPQGEHYETFESVVRVPGDVTYRAEFVPKDKDMFRENNQYSASIEVPGPPRVLIIDRNPAQVTYLAQALVAQQLDVDVRAATAAPQTLGELAPFHFVILSDLARSDFSRGAENLIEQYVRSGGGLLYAGGESAYGPGGWQGSRLEKILPVTMESQKEREVPGVAMALVIDRSGSMQGLPLAMAKEACNATVGVLDGNDLIEVIAFDTQPTRFVKMQPARYRSRIERSVATIMHGGGTEIFSALDMAYQDLAATEARKKHIILLTDGNANSEGIYELSTAAFAEGITITTVGLGSGINRALLTMISESGGGRFHPAEDPSKLPRIFTRETELISKKATLSDWFPVGLVHSAEFLKGVGIGAAPLLRGYTSTQMGPPPAELILMSDRGEPILARRPLGLGWTLAWTSDFKAHWATDWLKWGTFGRFIAQLVREHQKTDDTEIRPMEVEVVGDELIARLDAYDQADNFDSSLLSSLTVRLTGDDKAGTASSKDNASKDKAPPDEAQVPFHNVAPGLYQAQAPLARFGTYAVKAVHKRRLADGSLAPAGVSFASVTRPYPEEFRDLTPRPEALDKWAQAGGGQVSPTPAQIFQAGKDVVLTRVGRQNDFILLSILLFFLDLFVRRVRLFDRNFRARAAT